MKLIRVASQSMINAFSYRLQKSQMIRAFSTNWSAVDRDNSNVNADSSESADSFEKRMFGITGNSSISFYQNLEKIKRGARSKSGLESNINGGYPSGILDGLNDSFNTLQDGMDAKLMDAASYFEWNPDEVDQEGYTFRPDMNFNSGMTYEPKDLDLRKPGVWKPTKRNEFEVTTKEVLRKADFRNVRFLANFLTEAGILIKRNQTGISAKAQRKVAREIKTARAFGLLPFTTMGTKSFQVGRTMEDLDEDYRHASFDADIS